MCTLPNYNVTLTLRLRYVFAGFLISLIDLYFRCLSFRVVLVNAARPDGAFLFVIWFIHSKRMIRPFLFRDRPFNLQGGYGFLFRSEFFFRTTRELEYLFFLSRKAQFFFSEFNIRLYDKNQIIFFFLHQDQNIFFSNIGNPNIFLEKKHNPPGS